MRQTVDPQGPPEMSQLPVLHFKKYYGHCQKEMVLSRMVKHSKILNFSFKSLEGEATKRF